MPPLGSLIFPLNIPLAPVNAQWKAYVAVFGAHSRQPRGARGRSAASCYSDLKNAPVSVTGRGRPGGGRSLKRLGSARLPDRPASTRAAARVYPPHLAPMCNHIV